MRNGRPSRQKIPINGVEYNVSDLSNTVKAQIQRLTMGVGRRRVATAIVVGLWLTFLSAAPFAAEQLRFKQFRTDPQAIKVIDGRGLSNPAGAASAVAPLSFLGYVGTGSGAGLGAVLLAPPMRRVTRINPATRTAAQATVSPPVHASVPAPAVPPPTPALPATLPSAAATAAPAAVVAATTPALPTRALSASRMRTSLAEQQANPPMTAESIEIRNRAFRERVARAVETHPLLAGADNLRAVEVESTKEAKAALYPQIGMRMSGGHSLATPSESYSSSSHGRTDLVLSARQLIYDFGATFGRIDAAKFEERAKSFEVMSTAKQVTFNAFRAYLTVTTLRNQVALAEKNLANHEDIVDMVKARVEARAAPVSDINQVNSRMAIAQSRLSAFVGDLKRAEAVFIELFDEEAGQISLPVIDLTLPPNNDDTIVAAIGVHPQMKIYDMKVRAAKRMSDAAWGDKLPRLMLEADITRYDIDPTFDPVSGSGTQTPYGAVVRLNVVYDLFDGGSGKARENRAKFQTAKVQNDRDVFQRELSRQIRYAYADVSGNEGSIRALKLSVQAGKGTVYAYDRKYRIGRVSLIDLLDAQADLYQAAMEFNRARSDFLLAKFGVLMFTGGLLNYFDVDIAKFLDVSVPVSPAIHEIFTGGLLEYFSIDVTDFLDVGESDAIENRK